MELLIMVCTSLVMIMIWAIGFVLEKKLDEIKEILKEKQNEKNDRNL